MLREFMVWSLKRMDFSDVESKRVLWCGCVRWGVLDGRCWGRVERAWGRFGARCAAAVEQSVGGEGLAGKLEQRMPVGWPVSATPMLWAGLPSPRRAGGISTQ